MTTNTALPIAASTYDRSACSVGVVHLGFGAFHRSHQAVYLDACMEATGDLRWGIAAVNLRSADAEAFGIAEADNATHDGYYLKSWSADGNAALQRVRSHVLFSDWSATPADSAALLTRPSVHLVTITVTESGYYTDPDGNLNAADPTIAAELAGGTPITVYGYLRDALARRQRTSGAPLTIACCDNIRQNGTMLQKNLLAYLERAGDAELVRWVVEQVRFPCSMVDRITPRSPASLARELSERVGTEVRSPVVAEDFIQWVLEDTAAGPMPPLAEAGVTVTPDVHAYEETKIRVLNGGHTALTYLAALEGVHTFDEAMRVPELLAHFRAFEKDEVLPALTLDLPFSKTDYLEKIEQRFGNAAIGDTVARISADGMAKFPVFIRPTLEGCLAQGITPVHTLKSIASWHTFARHVQAGKITFDYVEPAWDDLVALLGTDTFLTSRQLWGDVPDTYPDFGAALQREITDLETRWPV